MGRLPPTEGGPDVAGFVGKGGAALLDGGEAVLEVFVGDGGKVVEVVEVNVGEAGGVGGDVAGDGEVNDEEGAASAGVAGGGKLVAGEEGGFGSEGAEDDVHGGEEGGDAGELDGGAFVRAGEFLSVGEGAAGDGDVLLASSSGAAAAKGLEGALADFARAEEEEMGVGGVAKDTGGKLGGDGADTDGTAANGGVGTGPFGGLETFLEDAVEDGAGGAAAGGVGVGVLDLAEDFGLADHLGIEAGGDVEDMGDDLLTLFPEDELGEFGGVEEVEAGKVFEELGAERGDFGGVSGDAVEFDAVAGVEDEGFGEVEAVGAAEEVVNGVEPGRGDGEALAHGEGGSAVGAAEEEELWTGRRHGDQFKNLKWKIQNGRGRRWVKSER